MYTRHKIMYGFSTAIFILGALDFWAHLLDYKPLLPWTLDILVMWGGFVLIMTTAKLASEADK